MLKQTIHVVLAILLTFGGQCYCSTMETNYKTSVQSSTTPVTPHDSISTSRESITNGNHASSSEYSSSTISAEVISTYQSTVSTSTETVSTNITTGSPSSTEVIKSSSISSTNSSSTTSGAVKNVTTDGINESISNAPPNTINTIATEGTTITSQQTKPSQQSITSQKSTSQPTTTTTQKTTKRTTGTTNNINGPSKNKGEPMSLEEKQRRNGIVSASICVGSLVLIGIAYLSSFVDKPSEKVPKFPKNKYNREDYKSPTKPVGTKKISFDNGFSIQETPTTSIHKPNLKSPVKTDQIESPIKTDQIELNSVENDDKNNQNENRRRTGWDVLSKDPAYFDNYQPKHTTTQAEVNEM